MQGNTKRRSFLKQVGAAGGGAALLSGIAGCTGAFGGGSDNIFKIGAMAPLSGPLAASGIPVQRGAEIAMDHANEGRDETLEMEFQDSKGSVETAQNLARQYEEEGVLALSGVVSSDVGVSMRDFAMENEIPLVPPITANPNVTKPGTEWVVRTYGDAEQIGVGTLEFFENEGRSSTAIIGADFSYPRTLVEFVEPHTSDYGVSFVSKDFVPLGTDNFTPTVSGLDDDAIDSILVLYPAKNNPVLLNQLRQDGFFEDNLIQGDNGNGQNGLVNVAGEDTVGVHYMGMDRETDRAQSLISDVRDRFDVRADVSYFQGYDAFRFLAKAIHTADDMTREAVYESLLNTDYEAAGGYNVEPGEGGINTAVRSTHREWVMSDGELVSEKRYKTDPIDLGR